MIHSKFSPSNMSAEQLERTFVQREALADRLTTLFAESALGDSKHHVLLVGPRGVGKSHLVSLVYNRLTARGELKDRLVPAYLREDEWGITSFLDLLTRVLKATGAETSDLGRLPTGERESAAWNLLRERMRGGTLFVIVENLDSVLSGLGDEGQKKWRSLMQTYPSWAVLATTPALSSDLSKQAAPFYGFFEIQNLEGLSFSQALRLLTRLALSQGNDIVAKYLASPAGRARVRAVQHLANGNHRVFVIFYDFLANGVREESVEPLLKTVDALTPYYQSQMRELSPQQRKLVEFLCEHRSAANVKTIAAQCLVSQQTAASQLKQILQARYVMVTRVGRESYYELNEPLLRICVEAKSHGGEPIRLLVEFLRYWFSRDELGERVAAMQSDIPERMYFEAALKEYDSPEGHVHLSPAVARSCVALTKASRSGDKQSTNARAEELAEVSKIAEDWSHYTRGLAFLGRAGEALPVLLRKASENPKDVEVLRSLVRAYSQKKQLQEALPVVEEAIRLEPRDADLWLEKGTVLEQAKNFPEALGALSQAEKVDPEDYSATLAKSRVLSKMSRHSEAVDLSKSLLGHGRRDPRVFKHHGSLLLIADKAPEALRYFKKAIRLFPRDPEALSFMGRALVDLKRPQEALGALRRAMKMDPNDSRFQHSYCRALLESGGYARAVSELPADVVAHQVFHQLLDIAEHFEVERAIRRALLRLYSTVPKTEQANPFVGGLIEFASHVKKHLTEIAPAVLRSWNNAISDVLPREPRFEMFAKIFNVIVRYKDSADERVLLELPLEQRKLLVNPPNA